MLGQPNAVVTLLGSQTHRGTAKCSPGLVLALGRQCGQGCASRGLLKSQGYFPVGGQLSTIGEKRLEAVLGRAGDLLLAMCSEVRCSWVPASLMLDKLLEQRALP